jgi:Domain of unknown function (DUF4390)
MNRVNSLSLVRMLCFSLVWVHCAVYADQILINRVSGKIVDGFYFIDADVHLELSEDARDAVESGVPLRFSFDFQVSRPRQFMWDQQILALRRSCQLERHALANKYVVTDLVSQRRAVLTSIDDALEELGRLRNITVGKTHELLLKNALHGRLRAQLDIEALPAPLRPIAYLSPSWHLKSSWHNWLLTR